MLAGGYCSVHGHPSFMQVRLLLFAKARECVGESEVEYVWGGKTTVTGREVLEAIVKSFPK